MEFLRDVLLERHRRDVLPVGLGRRAAFHHSVIDGLSAAEYEPEGKAATEVRRLYKAVCHLAGCHQAIKLARSQAIAPASNR